MNFIPPARECGECMACCEVLGVNSLAKPARQPCPHQCSGCAIYSTRPAECRAFQCLWLLGQGSDDKRPDRFGIIFYCQPLGEGLEVANGRPMLVANEVTAGALEENRLVLDRTAAQMPVLAITSEGRHFLWNLHEEAV